VNIAGQVVGIMLKVAIIGCGKIADSHAEQIQRIPACEIVGVCDQEELMAKQLYERFRVKQYFTDPRELFEVGKPDVVHITTPAQSHFELGKLCLEADASVYIEKPFTLNCEEAETLIDLATEKKLKITAGHNVQFSHVTRRMRALVQNGYLGGPPVHMESIYGYDFGDRSYATALLSDKKHWVRSLPGKLAHNIISHGVCRIAEFLNSENLKVIAEGFTSQFLRSLGESDIKDEIRSIIIDGNGTTAYFTFTSQMRPIIHQFRIYGPKNSVIVDDDHQILIREKGTKYKSYLDHFIPPFVYAKQYAGNGTHNVKKFIKHDFHMSSGMRHLIESFYQSVRGDAPLPIPYKEIILTARLMDAIFQQMDGSQSR
jgi:predicted dehydrogenase